MDRRLNIYEMKHKTRTDNLDIFRIVFRHYHFRDHLMIVHNNRELYSL